MDETKEKFLSMRVCTTYSPVYSLVFKFITKPATFNPESDSEKQNSQNKNRNLFASLNF